MHINLRITYKWLFAFVLSCVIGKAQGQERTLIIPQLYDESLGSKTITTDVKFFVYPYTSGKVDLRELKKNFPSNRLPAFVEIQEPDLMGRDDIYLLMAMLKEDSGNLNDLVIWIAADYNSNTVTLFSDANMDREFNDGETHEIQRGEEVYSIKIYPEGNKSRGLNLEINIPESNLDQLLKSLNSNSFKSKMWYDLVFGFHANIGIVKLKHDYFNLDNGFPSWYSTSLMEKEVGLSMSYYWPKLKLGFGGSYQNVFQYTSYFNDRLDEPMVILTGGQRVRRENVSTEVNKDLHSNHRMALDLLAGYRIHFSNTSEMQFIAGGGKVFFMNGEYISNKHETPIISYSHGANNFFKTGIQFEFATGRRRTLSFGLLYKKVWWKPTGFFESFNGTDLNVSYNTINFAFSYFIAT